jgi:eukaryotic-like serine/threonine-protein kinase
MDGIVLGNRYELLEKIGEGGMSEVFKARCNKLNRFVAVKILKKEFCNNPDIVEKFKGEATAIATLSDNNIVNILDVGTQDNINYIVMEYVKGKTLKDIIKQVGKMNYETAISVAMQIARALDCAHRNNIIHRDVKPQNILVTEDGIMKVTDFGIAKSATSETITNTSTIMGSAHYLSPEQAKGSFIDCRTDLYSLGVVLYEMVTGTLPFQADTAVTIALKHLQEEVVPPKNINSKVPDSLNQLILKAMEKEPIRRYQTAKEMIADLQKIKDDPNAKIDTKEEDNDHTIIMSAVTQQISKQNNSVNDEKYEDDDDDYYDDDEDEKGGLINKSKMMKIGIGVILVLLLAGLGVAAFKMTGNSVATSTKEVKLPDVVGKNVDDAKKQLEALNLVLVEADRENNDAAEGTIIKMKPDADTMVKEKSEVRVIVSSGKKGTKMPDLEDQDLDRAKIILKSYDIEVSDDNITQAFNDNVPKGQIISHTPKKDTEINSKTKVTLVVSKGPDIKFSTVPNLKGLDVEEAKSRLADVKLKYVVKDVDTQNQAENGKVLSQSNEGSKVEQGTPVTIEVGKYVAKQEQQPGATTPGTQKTPGTTDKTSGTTPGTTPGKGTTPSTGTSSDTKTTPGNTATSPFDSTKSN